MSETFAVKAETVEGKTLTLRRDFATMDAAEDHPVQMSLWRRVWIEKETGKPEKTAGPVTLPPLPWDWVAADSPTNNGQYQAYLTDANGRKIAAIWGRAEEKQMIADHILQSVNK